jgi:hypothetical protein
MSHVLLFKKLVSVAITLMMFCGETASGENFIYEGKTADSVEYRRIAYLKDPTRTFEEKLGDFLAYTNSIPSQKYLEALGPDRNEVLAKARDLSKIQLQYFKSFNDEKLEIPSEVDHKGFRALESLVYVGDSETLQELERLWDENLALIRFSTHFQIVLCRPDQPKTALIIGRNLELGVGLLDAAEDGQLKAKLNDPKINARFLRVNMAAIRFAEAVAGDHQIPMSARAWFQDESRRFDEWYIVRRGNDENRELAKMRWKHARAWHLLNRVAIEEGRYSDVRAPANVDRLPDESMEQAKGSASSSQPGAADSSRVTPSPSAFVAETALPPETARLTERNEFWLFLSGGSLVVFGAFVIIRRLMRDPRAP